MKSFYVVLLLVLLHSAVVISQSNPINKFKANFQATEFDITNANAQVRSYVGTFWFEDDWVASSDTGYQSMRFDINLNDGTTSRTLTQYYIFQDQFFEFTICNGKCAWADLFADEPLPQLYVLGTNQPSGPAITINQVSTIPYNITQQNAIGINFPNWVHLWVRAGTPQYAVRAEITYVSAGIMQRLDFSSQTNIFTSATTWAIPAGCPVITPGCFRVDLSLVQDRSGSVQDAGVHAGIQFFVDFSNRFLVDPKHVNIGLVSFSECGSITQEFPLQSSKTQLLALLEVANATLHSNGWTCIVGGIQYGFFNFQPNNGGRPATKKSLLIVTDGNGNRPCSTLLIKASPLEDCSQWNTAIVQAVAAPCGTISYSPCDGGPCCQAMHDWQLKSFYSTDFATWNPTIYAVGVGLTSDISDATLRLIINDPVAIARGDPRIFRVNSWFSLGGVIDALAKAIICDVEGSETCANDCRPGGFCCAGGCLCSIDCSLASTECQAGVCVANNLGANCVLGVPDNSSCQDPRIFCVDRYCVVNQGCDSIANDNKNCTDNNACTDDHCSGGVCVSVLNPSVINCDDHNNCTIDDACQPSGVCAGIVTDEDVTCDDGDLCTANECSAGACIVTGHTMCQDNDTSDCLFPQCDSTTGLCTLFPYPVGFECAPRDPFDNCTIFICAHFDPTDYTTCIANGNGDSCNVGQCIKATADLDECKSSSINTAGIIGGVVAGVAFIAIVALAIIILILFLLRKKVVDFFSGFNPFGADTAVSDNPLHAASANSGNNQLYS